MGLLSIFQRVGEFRDLSSSTALHPQDPALADLWGGGSVSRSAQSVTPDSALTVSTVMACVSRKAKTIAMLPLNVMRRREDGGHEVAKKHRIQNLISSRPNRWQTSYSWRLLSQLHVMLRGNAYSLLISTPGKGMSEIIPLDPDRIWPFVVTTGGASYYLSDSSPCPPPGSKLFYQYCPMNGTPEIYLSEEVLHIRGISSNGIMGKNVIKLMRESVGLAMATEEQGARLFSNGAQIGKVFTHPAKMSDQVYDRMRDQISKFSGVSNSSKTMILEEGMGIASTTMTMEDAQFLTTRQFQVEDLASFLDVPLVLINRSGDKNQTFASAEQIISMFVTHQMNPEFTNYEQEMGRTLLYPSEQGEYYIEFDVDGIMRGDSAARANFYKSLFGTASITIDEIRAKEHMSPLPNGEGKKVYILNQMIPLEEAGQQSTSNRNPAAQTVVEP